MTSNTMFLHTNRKQHDPGFAAFHDVWPGKRVALLSKARRPQMAWIRWFFSGQKRNWPEYTTGKAVV